MFSWFMVLYTATDHRLDDLERQMPPARMTTDSTTAYAPRAIPTPSHASRSRAILPRAAHDWSGVANCESTNRWNLNTGNGFYGGLQFTLSTWHSVGGKGYPHHATKQEQIYRAEKLLTTQGVGAWPNCGRYLK